MEKFQIFINIYKREHWLLSAECETQGQINLGGTRRTLLGYTKDAILLSLLLIKREGKDQAQGPVPGVLLTGSSPAGPVAPFARGRFLGGPEQAQVLPPTLPAGAAGPGSRPSPGITEPSPAVGDLFSCWKMKASV